MSSTTFQTTEEGMTRLVQELSRHVELMDGDRTTVSGLVEQIAAEFRSNASTAFQRNMHDWLRAYTTLLTKFEGIAESMGAVHREFQSADALSVQSVGRLH